MAKFEVATYVEVEAADEDDARRLVDDILQTAWERDNPQRDSTGVPWHFTIYDDAVREVPDD